MSRWLGIKIKNRTKGFTLMELLVVIAIIGLLSGVVLVSLSSARAKARDAKRKTDLSQIQLALEMYYDFSGVYPVVPGWWGECDSFGSHALSGSDGYVPNLAPAYMAQLPLDPKGHNANGAGCCYLYYSNGVDYKVLAHCTPETGYLATDPFYDPVRPTGAWQVSTAAARSTW
ncbi:MAG: prepilin-type N-terminal cleavage/methylation domain-containing protein [bacterium]